MPVDVGERLPAGVNCELNLTSVVGLWFSMAGLPYSQGNSDGQSYDTGVTMGDIESGK